MDDARFVRGVERPCDLFGDPDGLEDRRSPRRGSSDEGCAPTSAGEIRSTLAGAPPTSEVSVFLVIAIFLARVLPSTYCIAMYATPASTLAS
jgi:hypothetical protein